MTHYDITWIGERMQGSGWYLHRMHNRDKVQIFNPKTGKRLSTACDLLYYLVSPGFITHFDFEQLRRYLDNGR